ncbi:MAG: HAMP domain-containing histidine kinase, partial [Acidimicrobiales bacterium]|nr:HAMP domain-containing histidine kinase [Acidimicrobiales bacterium]
AEREAMIRELERSNQELGQFAHVASHDLKSPLRDIAHLAEWIDEDLEDAPESVRDDLRTLRQRTQRMDRLLTDLLAYARAGRRPGRVVEFVVCEAIEAAIELVPLPPGFSVETEGELDARLRTPRTPLETVLRNLVANAVKHHDRDAGTIAIRVDPAGADRLRFTVCDDGPGIPQQYHDKLFEMFETLRPRDEVEGSGVGLALCRRLVEAMGGTIGVESGDSRGSTFAFTWPRTWRESEHP